jgi:WD40 repeat protein/serine/threonine protein kinase
MNHSSGTTADDELSGEDAALAERAAALAERLKRGEAVGLDDCGDEELRNLMPTIRMMASWSQQPSEIVELGHIGDFRVVRELGRGGMGIVYEAIQVSLGRRVALKILRGSAALDPKSLRRFQVEAQAAASLRHPHIVPVFAYGSENGIAYYAMQYIECDDLARIMSAQRQGEGTASQRGEDGLVATRKPLLDRGSSFQRDVARLARQAATALEHAHAHDVLHRDVKPSNLLIDEKGDIWITDFGLASMSGSHDLTQTGEALGTPRYMSPEQAEGRRTPLDGRTDIYSLGATLYEILTLAPPFRGDDRLDLLRRIALEDPIPPRKIDPTISVDLETIVLKAMAKAPADRYATAADLADDLSRFLDDRPIRARRPSLLNRAGKWIRRHRTLMTAAGATGLVLTFALAAAAFEYTVWLRRHSAALEKEVARANRNADLANRHRRLANRHLHAAQLRLASAAIDNGQLERAQDILHDQVASAAEDDPRDFAWHVLWKRATNQIAPLYGHQRDVRALAMSPDGRMLASGDKIGTIWLWDLRSGSAICELKGHALPISRLVFSGDGSLLASAADASGHAPTEVFVWEAATGRELARLEDLDSLIEAVPVFMRDAPALRVLATPRESADRQVPTREIRTYDLAYGASRLVLRSTWRSDDYPCLSSAGQVVTIPRVQPPERDRRRAQDTQIGQWKLPKDAALPGGPVLTALTPDGRMIAAASGNNVVSCRESSTGKEVLRYTSESPLRLLALTADGSTLAAACESGIVELRSLATGRKVTLLIGPAGRKKRDVRLAFSPDGSRIATGEWGIPGGATPVSIWNVNTGERLAEYPGHRDWPADLLFAADGRSLVIAAGPTIRRWFLAGDSEPIRLAGHKDEAWSVAFAPDGGLLASGSDDDDPETIKLWDPASGKLIRAWYGGPGTTAALAFSPDGCVLASAHLQAHDNIRLWEVATGNRLAELAGHTGRARTLAFHPGGKLLASGGSDKTIRLWDVENRKSLAEWNGHGDTIQKLVFAPDGEQLASASADGTVRFWDVEHGPILRRLTGPEKFTAVEFSPDGRTLAGADEDGSITLWNAATGAQRCVLRDEVRVLRALAFSPDSRILAVGGEGGPVRLWDVLTAQELHSLPESSVHVHSLAFAPDGSSLAYASHDGAVRIYETDLTRRDARRGGPEFREPEPGRPSRRNPRTERGRHTGSGNPADRDAR